MRKKKKKKIENNEAPKREEPFNQEAGLLVDQNENEIEIEEEARTQTIIEACLSLLEKKKKMNKIKMNTKKKQLKI